MKFPKWTAAFCSLFLVNMFISGTMKVCGILFDSMATSVDGFTGSLGGLIFVTPAAVSHLIAPFVSVLCCHSSHRTLGSAGGVLAGGSYISAGLFATRGLHFLFFSIIAGVGFGLLFLPSVLCLREQAPKDFASLMPLASVGTYVGVAVLPGVVEVFVKNYGLHMSFCLFGALLWNTIPCGLILSGGQKHNLKTKDGVEPTEKRQNSKPTEPTPIEVYSTEFNVENKDELDVKCPTNIQNGNEDQHYQNSPIEKVTSFLKIVPQERIYGMFESTISFARRFLSQFILFGDIVFSLYFVTVNLRKFASDSWALFLIPFNQELGLQTSTAVIISAIGGIGGIFGRFLAAASFKTSNKVSPLTLFVFYYFCNALVFTLLDSWRNVFFMTFCGFASGLLSSTISGMTSGILLDIVTAKTYTQAFGLVDFGCGVYAIFTGYLAGGLRDIFGSFKVVFLISALVLAVSGISLVIIKLISIRRTNQARKHNPVE